MLAGTAYIPWIYAFTGPGRPNSKEAAHMYGKLVLDIGGKHHFFSMIASSQAG